MDQGEGTPPAQDTEGNKEQAPTPAETHDTAINSKSAQAESQSSQKKKRKNWPQRVEAGCAVLLVFITGYYAYYAKKQRDAMLDSNKITRDSLTINRDALQLNRDSSESVQRAFVRFTGISPRHGLQLKESGRVKEWDFICNWENSGNTPAIGVVQHFNAREFPKGEPNDEEFEDKRPNHPVGTIGPRGIDSSEVRKPESFLYGNNPDFQHTHPVPQNLFLWGWVVYRDVFPNTKPHVTEFCVRVAGVAFLSETMPQSILPDVMPPAVIFTACNSHNCIDNYCKDYDVMAKVTP